ncbi:MAG: hypothetical protein WA139_03725 [Candidatus Aenigmatarchaeota archaeon]
MFGGLIYYFTKKKEAKPTKITREDYESAVRAMQSMEKDELVEPGYDSYRIFWKTVDEYKKQNQEEFH